MQFTCSISVLETLLAFDEGKSHGLLFTPQLGETSEVLVPFLFMHLLYLSDLFALQIFASVDISMYSICLLFKCYLVN